MATYKVEIQDGSANVLYPQTISDNVIRPSTQTVEAALATLESGKEPAFAAGTATQYRRGDKTWQELAAAVLGVLLTGLAAGTNAAIAATDSILGALQKLHAQVTAAASAAATAQTTANGREPAITAGTTAQYWRGDKTWQTLPTVPTTPGAVGAEPAITAGTTAQYWRGDKTWQDRDAAVRATALTGLASSTVEFAASDTVLAAFGKAMGRINAKENTLATGTAAQYYNGTKALTDFATSVRGSALTGFVAAAGDVAASDTVLSAINKLSYQATQTEAEAGTVTVSRRWTPQRVAQAVRGVPLTGLAAVANPVALAATDSSLVAWAKIRNFITRKGSGTYAAGTAVGCFLHQTDART